MDTWQIPDDLYVYDCEVFPRYWLFVFKNHKTGEYKTFDPSDYDGMKDFYETDPLLCGFNNLGYDKWIAKAVLMGLSCPDIKEISEEIITHGQKPWTLPQFDECRIRSAREFDLMSDTQAGLSLKAFEGHMGMNIKETEVDFDTDRCLTDEEKARTLRYCTADVNATEKLFVIRKDYLESKVFLGRMAGLDDAYSLSKTNQKLDCEYLGAVRTEHNDARVYVPPKQLDLSLVPKGVMDFLMTINNTSIPDDVIFPTNHSKKGKEGINYYSTAINGCPVNYGWGGVHGALPCVDLSCGDDEVFEDRDVKSLYPSLMIVFGYLSRNVGEAGRKRFCEAKQRRIEAKNAGDKATAKALKLPLNTTSGGMDARFSDLYDPHNARSMRITGELLITELVCHLARDVPTFQLVNLNTDGFFYRAKKKYLPTIDAICDEWCKRTGLELEADHVDRMIQKDVNNYIAIEGDEVKKTGHDLNWGLNTRGAFSVNNSNIAVKKALVAYLIDRTPIEKTIAEDRDPLDFQMIAKVGAFDYGYQATPEGEVRTQKVNRVYASKDKTMGTLYRVKGGQCFKIAGLPDHCLIDNDCHATRDEIDDKFYVDMARKKADDFMPRKEDTQMTLAEATKEETKKEEPKKEEPKKLEPTKVRDVTKLNVWQRLAVAKKDVSETPFYKSGSVASRTFAYDYVALGDFLPAVTKILTADGLVATYRLEKDVATLDVLNVDKPEEHVPFSMPVPSLEYFTQNGNFSNPADAMKMYGAYTTYSRRYLYLIALDLITADEIEESEKMKDKALEQKALEKKVADRKKAIAESAKVVVNAPAVNTPKEAPKSSTEAKPVEEHTLAVAETPKPVPAVITAPATPADRAGIVKKLTRNGNCENFIKFSTEANEIILSEPKAKADVVKVIAKLKGDNPDYKETLSDEAFNWALVQLKEVKEKYGMAGK